MDDPRSRRPSSEINRETRSRRSLDSDRTRVSIDYAAMTHEDRVRLGLQSSSTERAASHEQQQENLEIEGSTSQSGASTRLPRGLSDLTAIRGERFLRELDSLENYTQRDTTSNFEERFHTTVKQRTKKGTEKVTETNRQDFFRVASTLKRSWTRLWLYNDPYFRSYINPAEGIVKIPCAFADTGIKIRQTRRSYASEIICHHFLLARSAAIDKDIEVPDHTITKIILSKVIESNIRQALGQQNIPKEGIIEFEKSSNDENLRNGYFIIFTTPIGKAIAHALKQFNEHERQRLNSQKKLVVTSIQIINNYRNIVFNVGEEQQVSIE
jgi:hypothetical protein